MQRYCTSVSEAHQDVHKGSNRCLGALSKDGHTLQTYDGPDCSSKSLCGFTFGSITFLIFSSLGVEQSFLSEIVLLVYRSNIGSTAC